MELKVHIPSHPPEPQSTTAFDFGFGFSPTVGSHCSSPANSACYLSAPSSPPLNLCFYSAPTSPSPSPTIIPFNWGVPRPLESASTHCNPDDEDNNQHDDFEFDFSGQLIPHPSADELFHGGKIRPLKPPPGLQPNSIAQTHNSCLIPPKASPPRSPRSPIAKFRGAFSPRRRKEEHEREKGFLDPFETALERTRKSDFSAPRHHHRGRALRNNNPRRNRSLSPLRVSEFALLMQQQQQEEEVTEDETQQNQQQPLSSSSNYYSSYSSTSSSTSSSSSWSLGYRKWHLKDFFLFRSASEGRATGKSDPLNKYYNNNTPTKMSSSILSDGSVGSTSSRRRTVPSTTEPPLYTASRNRRLISEDLKKKTSLPYKYGLLGCLGFNPITSGFGFQDVSSSRGFGGSSSFMRQ